MDPPRGTNLDVARVDLKPWEVPSNSVHAENNALYLLPFFFTIIIFSRASELPVQWRHEKVQLMLKWETWYNLQAAPLHSKQKKWTGFIVQAPNQIFAM